MPIRLFASSSCICLVYVDNTLLFPRSQVEIEDIVQGIKNLGMDLEEEEDEVAGFLGVLILRHPGTNPTLELLQTSLPQRVVDALQICGPSQSITLCGSGIIYQISLRGCISWRMATLPSGYENKCRG
jgi:hypothetical protein